jgi:streptogramin lyase
MRHLTRSFLPLITVFASLLAGCSANFAPAASTEAVSIAGIQGNVHGGRQPVVSAHVYIYAAGTGGYGTASTSLLTAFSTGSFPTAADSNNNYYVTTDANGNFQLTSEYKCTANTQVYLYAVGGNPGLPPGQTNSAAGFLAILGNCPATQTLALQTPYVVMNEVSTIAAAYSFAAFATDATHVASSGTPLALTGIANAFASANNLYDISGGNGGLARKAPATSVGFSPQTEVHALANSLAACVNSTGPSSTQCSALFDNVKSNGSTGTTATDTATLAINIAHNPTNAISTILSNPAGIGTPFLPTLPATPVPTDLTLEVDYYSATLGAPTYIAIDAAGNVWVSCYSAPVSKYSPTGALLSGLYGYTGGGLNHSTYIAIDSSGNAWLANQTGGTITEFSPNGVPANTTGFAGNNDLDPAGIAFDASGYIWVSNYDKNTISKLDTTGAEVTGSPYALGGLDNPWELAIDGTGNVWVGNNTVNEVVRRKTDGTSTSFTGPAYDTPRSMVIGANGTAYSANYADGSLNVITSSGAKTTFTGGGIQNPSDVAVDGLGNIWVANYYNNNISELSSTGAAISPSVGYKSPDLDYPYGIAVDGSGNVWTTNASGDTLSEFIGAAAPTITPVVSAIITSSIATRP